jgi:hypothetical protein
MAKISWALTLTQPWASLVAIGAKSIETRSWGTKFRGPIAIHAAKGFPGEARAACHELPFEPVLQAAGYQRASDLPRGVIVAVAVLTNCWQFDKGSARRLRNSALEGRFPSHEIDFGDYSAGRWGFCLESIRAVETPIAARGMLGLWALPDEVRTALHGMVAEAKRNGTATKPENEKSDPITAVAQHEAHQ